MKKFFLIVTAVLLASSIEKQAKVLLFIEDSGQLGYMLIHEVNVIIKELTISGYQVTTATLSGETLFSDTVTLVPDLKLAHVNPDAYEGFVLPCMASDTSITTEEIEFVKHISEKNKLIAAQVGAVQILARAGALKDRKYAFADEPDENPGIYSEFDGAIFCGNGVVQDGNIITSGTCPWMAKMTGKKDGTVEMIQKFIRLMEQRGK